MLRLPALAAILAIAVSVACAGPAADEVADIPGATPDSFRVAFQTSKGRFVVQVNRAWAPQGADRFFELIRSHFYDENRFFRVVPGFVVQWGISDDKAVNDAWGDKPIPDDPVTHPNELGTITFATPARPNARTRQVFINLGNNQQLDGMGFAPFGRVVEGMSVVESINSEYGERPDQTQAEALGNKYLARMFPNLDYVKTARFLRPTPAK
ncbi:MAG TPA: peptidylprolyl isomerase [Gemmatimonadaceae bacterium]